jgi:hypothetical protein
MARTMIAGPRNGAHDPENLRRRGVEPALGARTPSAGVEEELATIDPPNDH